MPRFHQNRIALIHGNDGTDVRVGKICRSLSKMGADMHFVGWDRRPAQEKVFDLGATETYIMEAPTHYGRSTLSGNVKFFFHILASLRRLRPNTVWCVNEDHALLVLPYRGLYYRRMVCDVFDALYDRHSHRNWLARNALRAIANLCRTNADTLIATDETRYETFGQYRSKCVVVENYPEDPGDQLADTLPQGPVKVYVAGTLNEGHGLRELLAAIETIPDIEVVSAGWLFDDFARDTFAKHSKVTFHGILTASESLRLASQCDAILAFYEPTSVNNRQASPNKVYDAMSVGRPVIINEECGVSKWIVSNNVGYRLPYSDVEGLKQLLQSLRKRREMLARFATNSRDLFRKGYSWQNLEPRLEDVYKKLTM